MSTGLRGVVPDPTARLQPTARAVRTAMSKACGGNDRSGLVASRSAGPRGRRGPMSNHRQRLARLERLLAGRPRCPDGCVTVAIIEPGQAPPADLAPCPRWNHPGAVLILMEEIVGERDDGQ